MHERADLMDGADGRPSLDRSVGAHHGRVAAPDVEDLFSRLDQSRFDDAREGDARLASPRRRSRDRLFGEWRDRLDALLRGSRVSRIALDANEGATEASRDRVKRPSRRTSAAS